MPRPKRFRRLTFVPPVYSFLPEGVPPGGATVSLRVEELEAMRLIDLEGLDQERAARHMGVSRPTIGRILAEARRAVTEALVEGRAISITGGVYRYERGGRLSCPHCRHSQPLVRSVRRTVSCRRCCRPVQAYEGAAIHSMEEIMELTNARIAIVSDDGRNVSSHFGRAPLYIVLTMSDGVALEREERAKFAPHGPGGQHGHGHDEEESHAAHSARHRAMFDSIRDCQVVVARGMGDGAYIHLTEAGLAVVLTQLHSIEEVVEAIKSGSLQHQPQRLHSHGPERHSIGPRA